MKKILGNFLLIGCVLYTIARGSNDVRNIVYKKIKGETTDYYVYLMRTKTNLFYEIFSPDLRNPASSSPLDKLVDREAIFTNLEVKVKLRYSKRQ